MQGSTVPCFHCQEQLLAISPNGDIFPSCNKFIVHKDTRIGNINDMGFDEALGSVQRSEVLDKVMLGIRAICTTCDHFHFCKGGCYFVAFEQEDPEHMTRDQFCKGYHLVFDHILEQMRQGKVVE